MRLLCTDDVQMCDAGSWALFGRWGADLVWVTNIEELIKFVLVAWGVRGNVKSAKDCKCAVERFAVMCVLEVIYHFSG